MNVWEKNLKAMLSLCVCVLVYVRVCAFNRGGWEGGRCGNRGKLTLTLNNEIWKANIQHIFRECEAKNFLFRVFIAFKMGLLSVFNSPFLFVSIFFASFLQSNLWKNHTGLSKESSVAGKFEIEILIKGCEFPLSTPSQFCMENVF